MKNIQLLNQVYNHLQNAQKQSIEKGEYFNIFNVLKIETDEVTTHNRFMAELLNPIGKHLKGDVFLQLFYQQIACKLENSGKDELFERIKKEEKTTVKAEYWLGNVDLENQTGGYIDVCILTQAGQIRIENKIYAGEQEMQLKRYCHNHENQNIVFYLTLDGKEALSNDHLISGTDYFLLSHAEDTVAWLEQCMKAVEKEPILYNNIKQYLILIKKLTGQTTSKQMDKELQALILKDSQSFQSAKQISKSYNQAVENEYNKIIIKIEKKLQKSYPNLSINSKRGNRTDGGFINLKTIEIEKKKYDIGINIELGNNYCFFCAIQEKTNRNPGINKDPKFNPIKVEIQNAQISGFSESTNNWNLTGVYKFNAGFTFSNYLDDKEEVIVQGVAQEIINIITKTKWVKLSL